MLTCDPFRLWIDFGWGQGTADGRPVSASGVWSRDFSAGGQPARRAHFDDTFRIDRPAAPVVYWRSC